MTPLPPFATSGALGTSLLNGENLFSAAPAYFNLAGGALAPAARDLTRAKADLAQGRRKVRGYPKYDLDQDPDADVDVDVDVDKSVTDRKRAAINQVEKSKAKIAGLKRLFRFGTSLGVLGVPVDLISNSSDMSLTENLTRTGFSTAFGTAAGAGGVICGPFAPACGPLRLRRQ